ncbi:uncharacterized protein LOC135688444 isoform X2 [Rhopilema esculentum]
MSMSSGKKLQSYIGDCCQFPKWIWRANGEIWDFDNKVCLGESDVDTDVEFIDVSTACAKLNLTPDGRLLKKMNANHCVLRDGENHKYRTCPSSSSDYVTVTSCGTSVANSVNQWFMTMFNSISYCWTFDSFGEGKKAYGIQEANCCNQYRFISKSNGDVRVMSAGQGGELCLQVDGMPSKQASSIDGKDVKLETTCEGSAFIYDSTYNLLRIVGTDRCLGMDSSDDIRVGVCSSFSGTVFSSGTCTPFLTSQHIQVTSSVSSLASSFTNILSSSLPHSSSFLSSTQLLSSLPSSSLTLSSLSSSSQIISTFSPTFSLSSSSLSSSLSSSISPSSLSSSISPSSLSSSISPSSLSSSISPSSLSSSISPSSLSSSISPSSLSSSISPSSLSSSISPSSLSLSISPSSLSLSIWPSSLSLSISPSSSSLSSPFSTISSFSSSKLIESSQDFSRSSSSAPQSSVLSTGDPVDGAWGQWTPWAQCSVNCGDGVQERLRYCDDPAPSNGGAKCDGLAREEKACNMSACSGITLASLMRNCALYCQSLGLVCSSSIDTGNSKESFMKVGATCSSDESSKLWTRDFDPAFYTDSYKCAGYVSVPSLVQCNVTAPSNVKRLCNCVQNDDLGFGPWTPWSACTETCNGGQKTRTRLCLSEDTSKKECQGKANEIATCNWQKCPIDGGFSEWSKWTTCTKSCDGGTRTRNRTCSDPFPVYGGSLCFGNYTETELCSAGFCQINGGWTNWTSWQQCNKPCNTGERLRQRWCENPLPMYGGKVCEGNGTETAPCNTNICPNVSITLRNVAFDEVWKDGYALASGAMFADFARKIDINVKRLYDGDLKRTYDLVQLHNLSPGSVIASFTLYFTALDSFQALFLMDAIDNDHYLGKLPIVENKTASFSSPIVPSSPPSNVTAVSNDASSIDVSWNEVPSPDQNGVITGYLLFYRESSATTYTIAATTQLKLKIQGLSAATSYSLRVLAYNSNGNGIASELNTLTTREKAPSLPPQSISVVPMSAFSLFVEWTHPPRHSWNGIIAGYKVDIKSDDGSFSQSLNVDGTMVNMNVNGLSPDRLYIVDVCASTSVGTGPCIRSYNKTFVSTPSISPANAGCQNKTSTSSIIVSYEPIPIAFIHGILKGYRIEYRLMSVGSQSKSNSRIQAVTVSPFRKQATLEKLEPNCVYEIRVMAVNEHGAGIKSPAFYGETCSCPEVIYTNYAALKPYIYRDTQGNMVGIFENLLKNITSAICGLCNGRSSRIDFINDGKNGWAEKQSIAQVAKAIDDYVHLSFAIAGREEMPTFQGKPYISLIDHPGMVLYTPRPTMSEQVEAMLTSIFQLWPIFILNAVFIIFAGVIFFTLTYDEAAVDGPCWFVSGSLRGMYWAYVTMFTHGYGDIVPSSIVSRIFAVLWILVGLVTSAILIGGISTALTTSSTLPGVKLYNTELAVVQGSKEEIVGILRNAKVNTKGQYGKTEDVFHALKDRQVEAALVDAFVAASRSDLFEDQAIIARKMIKYSYTYGVVLSGAMKNTGTSIKNYVSDNRQYITQMVEKTAPQLTGTFADPQPVSLFEPSSPFLSQTLIALFIVYILLFIAGSIFSFVRRRKRGKVDVTQQEIDERLNSCELACRQFFESVENLCKSVQNRCTQNEKNNAKLKTLKRDSSIHSETKLIFVSDYESTQTDIRDFSFN